MEITRYSLKWIFLLVALIGGFFFLVILTSISLTETDVERVMSWADCEPRFWQLIHELDQQNIKFDDCEVYRADSTYFLSCSANETQLIWLKSNLGLKDLDSHDSEVIRLYRLGKETPLSLPKSKSTKFYRGVTGQLHDHFFIAAYDNVTGQLLIWYYNLI